MRDVDPDDLPTLDAYLVAANELAKLVRQTLDRPGSVKRSEVKTKLETFERVNQQAMS